jgi:two-component system, cell cycle sensor histidine kinase and response regulator CckA
MSAFGRIMIVEADSMMRLVLATSLVAPHREIVPALHGINALMLFQDYDGKFDAIITDNEMPEMDGLKLVSSLREKGFKGQIIVMSGGMTPHKLAKYRELGIDGYLAKPFGVALLVDLLGSK